MVILADMRNLGAVENTRTFLETTSTFSPERPYRIWRKAYRDAGEQVCLHYHPLMELLLAERAAGSVTADGLPLPLPDTPLVYLHPGSVHDVRIEQGEGSILVLQISPEALAPDLDLERLLAADNLSLNRLPPVPRRWREVEEVMRQLEGENSPPAIRFSAMVLRIVELLCDGAVPAAKRGPHRPSAGSPERIRRIIDWTEKKFAQEITLERAAEEAGYSRTAFCRFFRRETGSSYFSFLRRVRLEHACRLLEKGESVTVTALECGFGDISWFIECFSECYGITPKQYRNSAQLPTPF